MRRGVTGVFLDGVVPFLALAVLPLVLLRRSTPEVRRAGNQVGFVYLLLLLGLELSVPLATGVARWESDVFEFAQGRIQSTSYAAEVVFGVLLLRPLVALGEGLVIARLRRRGSWVVLSGALIYALGSEVCSLVTWAYEWLGSLVVMAVSWPDVPSWISPPAVLARVGLSYFGPPLLAGVFTGLAALRLVRPGGEGRLTTA